MRQSGLKWLVGGLMVSASGIVAVTGLPSRTGGIIACDAPPALPIPMVNPTNLEPPIAVPTPKPSELPMAPAQTAPAPAPLSIPPIVETAKIPEPPKPIDISKPSIPEPKPSIPEVKTEIPRLEEPTKPALNPLIPAAAATPLPLPIPSGPESRPATVPAQPLLAIPGSAPSPVAETPSIPAPVPTNITPEKIEPGLPAVPVFAEPIKPAPTAVAPTAAVGEQTPPRLIENKPIPASSSPTLPEPTTTAEKKLKVILHLGDERPRFEVRDGDDVYLKVLCERVDVKSPGENGENMSVLRATGKVKFTTPGGEGTCDELMLTAGTGQVTVQGKVAFKYNWGKVETTVSGNSMTFRLGAGPVSAASTEIPSTNNR